ncbi:MAG: cupredoxin domain-containing protein [bacterium]|nr:cupredoxin domain-containing protein [bacterium]
MKKIWIGIVIVIIAGVAAYAFWQPQPQHTPSPTALNAMIEETPTASPAPSEAPLASIEPSGTAMPSPTPKPTDTPQTGIKEFTVTARQFSFEPGTIRVNVGDRVKLRVTSIDVEHGLAIPEFSVNEQLPPNTERVVEFTADKAGTFTIFCSVFCGSGHGSMRGTLIVE